MRLILHTAGLKALVEQFEATPSARSPGFKEDWARSEFIEPFFEVLGWKRLNPATITNRSSGFIREDAQRVARSVKAPDYAFIVEGRRAFFVEAKKPAVKLKTSRESAYQLRRYAWNAGHAIGLLTDFEELALYDCRLQPSPEDDANVGLLEYVTSDTYLQRASWLEDTLSPEAVSDGSLGRLIESAPKRRNLRPPDAAFLEDIESWRLDLAKSLTKGNPGLSTNDLNFAVQATIDRIVFLRIAEARGLEEEQVLDQIAAAPQDLYEKLLELFERADARYNSGLFHFSREQGRADPDRLTPGLKVDDRTLRGILTRLSHDRTPYDFGVMPADILGRAYEQFLGRVVEVDAKGRIEIVQKPEVRKAEGVFYTPKYIVDYIVEQTMRPLLARKTPGQVVNTRILDPACGSGSFLIGAYEYLLEWHLAKYSRGGTRFKRHLTVGADGRPRLTIEARKQILLNNVFGVDIDPQAVEVTKLSLLLKVIEGETQLAFLVDRLLPDLDANIQCGNSLVSTDFYVDGQLNLVTPNEARSVNAFDWDTAFPHVLASGGFDGVIGNPPWLMAGYYVPDSMEYFRDRYRSCTGKADLYYLFLEKATRLLQPNARVGMIVPNKFFHTTAAKALRGLLTEGDWIDQVVDFGTNQIFPNATNYSCILQLRRGSRGAIKVSRASAFFTNVVQFDIERDDLGEAPWRLTDATRTRLWKKLEKQGSRLEDVVTRFGTGIQTGADRLLLLSAEAVQAEGLEATYLRPALRGRDVRQYKAGPGNRLMVFPYRNSGSKFELVDLSEIERRAPNTFDYLKRHRKELEQRVWFGKSAKELAGSWHGLMYVEARSSFTSPYLLTPSLSATSNFARGDGELFLTGTAGVTSMVLDANLEEDLYYFLAILNSRLLATFMSDNSPPYQGGFFKYSAPYLRKLPIARVDLATSAGRRRHDNLVGLARRFEEVRAGEGALDEGTREPMARVSTRIEEEIDDAVNSLYGLTSADVAAVNEGVARP